MSLRWRTVYLALAVGFSSQAVEYRYLESKCSIWATQQDIYNAPVPLPNTIEFSFGGTSDPSQDDVQKIAKENVYYPTFIEQTKFKRAPGCTFNNAFCFDNFSKAHPQGIFFAEHWGDDTVLVSPFVTDLRIDSLRTLRDLFVFLGKDLSLETLSKMRIQPLKRVTRVTFTDNDGNRQFDVGDTLQLQMSTRTYQEGPLHETVDGSIQFHLPQEVDNGLSLHLYWQCSDASVSTLKK